MTGKSKQIPLEKRIAMIEATLNQKQPLSHVYSEIIQNEIFSDNYEPRLPPLYSSQATSPISDGIRRQYKHVAWEIDGEIQRLASSYRISRDELIRLFTSRLLKKIESEEFDILSEENKSEALRPLYALFNYSGTETDKGEMADVMLGYAEKFAERDSMRRHYSKEIIKMLKADEQLKNRKDKIIDADLAPSL